MKIASYNANVEQLSSVFAMVVGSKRSWDLLVQILS